MSKVIHFKNSADRIDFIRGKHTEIKPIEVKAEEKEVEVVEEKPKKKTRKKKAEKKEETE